MKIISICYQPDVSQLEDKEFNRVPMNSVELIANHGIKGDRKAGRNPKRQVNIMSMNTVQLLHEIGFKTAPDQLGEQLVVDGLDIMSLPVGTQIQMGELAVIELTMVRTGCEWLEMIHSQSKNNTINRLGMLAKVVQSGTIRVGDTITVLEPIPSIE
jgi:MOSC domain-containing protein YiiM